MFEDIVELLLQKKVNLREEIEREFAERSAKIDALLDMAGYVEPVEEVVEEAEEVTDDETDVNAAMCNETVY